MLNQGNTVRATKFLKAVTWPFRYMYCSSDSFVIFQLYSVNSSDDAEESIYGIMFEKFPATPKSDRKYFIMVSTLRYSNLHVLFTVFPRSNNS